MTDCNPTTAENGTSRLCLSPNESNTFIDEIPSLDVLSFEHEHCPSQSCLCHNMKHLQNGRNNSGLYAFGVKTAQTLAEKPVSSNSTAETKELLAQPTFQPLITASPTADGSTTDTVSASSACNRVFGSEHGYHSVDSLQSFAQLCSTTCTNTPEIAATGPSLTFEQSHRDGQLTRDTTRPAQDIDLSELQSALLTTTEDPPPVSECPVHWHPGAVERIPACTCGQQASRLDDCTFDELAAYFDNFCYIPKNMSPMAEMMYM